jgi:hypothetical protein
MIPPYDLLWARVFWPEEFEENKEEDSNGDA